jgi:hypothetical protein
LFLAPGEGDSVPADAGKESGAGENGNGSGERGAESQPNIAEAAKLLRGRQP